MADADADDAIIARSASDPASFETLVRRHATALHGYLSRRAPDVADDLFAEVWLTAFRRRRDFDPTRGSIIGWLFGIARTHLLAHRRSAAMGALRSPLTFGRLSDDGGWSAVDARLDAAAAGTALRAALHDLPEVERELLLLIAWEDLSPTEAGQVLGIPAGTARSRLHRARARMRDRLEPAQPGEPDRSRSSSMTNRMEPDHG